jgi:hypothetical protein
VTGLYKGDYIMKRVWVITSTERYSGDYVGDGFDVTEIIAVYASEQAAKTAAKDYNATLNSPYGDGKWEVGAAEFKE